MFSGPLFCPTIGRRGRKAQAAERGVLHVDKYLSRLGGRALYGGSYGGTDADKLFEPVFYTICKFPKREL